MLKNVGLTKAIWKVGHAENVEVFLWILTLEKLNSYDKIHRRMPNFWEGFCFMKKLRSVKGCFKAWNLATFRDTRLKKAEFCEGQSSSLHEALCE